MNDDVTQPVKDVLRHAVNDVLKSDTPSSTV